MFLNKSQPKNARCKSKQEISGKSGNSNAKKSEKKTAEKTDLTEYFNCKPQGERYDKILKNLEH